MKGLYRTRQRSRPISFEKIVEIKEEMYFSWEEVDNFLGVGSKQRSRYQTTGVPAERYYAFRDALLLAAEEDSRKIREKILKLFN